ncbi:MAG: hypothetical protein Q8P18_23025 [Pseudomonadota bacterium]|nr:hypothetical protein [Pseudomonadota bacterium]
MPASSAWIISRATDLRWFIGSALASYAILGLALVLPARDPADFSAFTPVVLVFLVWGILFDGSHVFATYTRTYFDREAFRGGRALLLGSLGWIALGPAAALLDAALGHDGRADPQNGLVYTLFLVFAFSWAYYHLIKQHYGFLMLYKRKNADLLPVDNTLDKRFLWVGFGYPYLRFLFGSNIFASGLMGRHTQAEFEGLLGLQLTSVAFVLDVAFAVATIVYLGRLAQRWWGGQPVDLPKYLLLAAAIPMHVLVLRYVSDLLLVVAALTIMHNLQYHRLVWFHNQNAYQSGRPDAVARHGAAVALSRSVLVYLLAGIAFAIPYRMARTFSGDLFGSLLAEQIIGGAVWGVAFHHYYVDAKIWKLRANARVREDLKLETAGA